jgi:membrane-associated protease RseP (regulator of RpoE activity)
MAGPLTPPPTTDLDAVEALRRDIAPYFAASDTTIDYPEKGHIRYRGRFLVDPAECFDDLRLRFERFGYTPTIREEEGRVELVAWPVILNPAPANPWINLALFIATVLSTLFVGTLYAIESTDQMWELWRGLPFALSIMTILGAHELGHYFAARHHKVPVTLPYFIPMPLSAIGTLGAFIRLQAPESNRRSLLDIGAAGPLAGLVFAVPILLYGLATSELGPISAGATLEGNSILYLAAKFLIFGQILPTPEGIDVQLNQVAWAGWVGLLVTALNLIPVGQLDGGHIAYALFGKKSAMFYWPVLIGLALITAYSFLQGTPAITWLVWIFLLGLLGRRYARPLDDVTTLDPRRRAIGIAALVLFALVFVPLPLTTIP